MGSALAWLNDLVQWLGRWIPRLVLIHPTHRGVRFGPRGQAVAVGPGLVMYWPMTHELIQVAITMQSVQFVGQILHLDHGGPIPVVAICVLNAQFEIVDPVKASTRTLHFMALIQNRAQSLVAEKWKGSMENGWIQGARNQMAEEMLAYGIRLEKLEVAGLGIGMALKQIADWSYADTTTGERPKG